MIKCYAKRWLVLILAVIMTFQLFTFLPASAGVFKDVTDETLTEAVEVLNYMGIVKGRTADTFSPDTAIKRSEMASICVRLLNMDGAVGVGEQVFEDVNAKNSAFTDIYIAHKLGIINGTGEGKFTPKREVTYEQAIKMIVCLLGYEAKAVAKGGYPTGYYAVATELGLLRSVQITDLSAPAKRSDIALMAYRALTVDLMQNQYNGDLFDDKIGVTPGESLFTKFFGYKKVDGVITGNYYTSITSSGIAKRNHIVVDDVAVDCGDKNLDKYIGYEADIYYETDGHNNNKLVAYFITTESTLELTHASGIAPVVNTGDAYIHFEYSDPDSGKLKTVKANPTVLYNGKYLPNPKAELPAIFNGFVSGKVILVENDGDRFYDFIRIDESAPGLVKSVDTATKKIYYSLCNGTEDKYSYDLEEYNGNEVTYSLFSADGKTMKLDEIKKDDVISVYRSNDSLLYEIWVSTSRVEGEISSINEKGEIHINDGKNKPVKYLICDGVDTTGITVGRKTLFYLDKDGNIAYYDNSKISEGNFGLLFDVSWENSGSIIGGLVLRILNSDGKFVDIPTEESVYAYSESANDIVKVPVESLIYDGQADRDYASVPKYMLWYTDNVRNFTYETDYRGKFYYRPWLSTDEKSEIASRKPVYYEQNGAGKITKILVPDIPVGSVINSLHHKDDGTGNYYRWTQRGGRTNSKYVIQPSIEKFLRINENALCFFAGGTTYAQNDYSFKRGSACGDGSEYRAEMYEINGSGTIDIISGCNSTAMDSATPIIVGSTSYDLDGNTVIYGTSYNEKTTEVILQGTYLVERALGTINVVNGATSMLTSSTVRDYTSVVDLAVSSDETVRTPAVEVTPDTFKKGDVIRLRKNDEGMAVGVEVIMRAENGVGLISMYRSVFSDMIYETRAIVKGCVIGTSGDQTIVRYRAPYNGDVLTSASSYGTTYTMVEGAYPYHFDYDRTFIWKYDYGTGRTAQISSNDLKPGDMVISFGSTMQPTQCIVLENYPCDNFDTLSYWTR